MARARVTACFLQLLLCAYVAGGALVNEASAQAYRSHGHLVTRDILGKAELGRLATRLQSLLREHGRRAFGDSDGKKEVRFTFAVHELDATASAFVNARDGALWRTASQLAGTRDLCVLMDRGFSKDPGDPETHWHRDDEAVGLPAEHPSLRTVHAWIPLSAMDRTMGTLQYLVGTHRREYEWYERLLASLWGWEFAWFTTAPKAQDDKLELGDVAWHDGWVLHSAGANGAGAVRDGFAVSFAYCAGAGNCGGAAAPVSRNDTTCRIAERLFDAGWRARHRDGENDYAKTLLREPFANEALRFVWRSLAGGLMGLAGHWLAVSCCCTKRKSA